jgi:transglutaminase-like putative cysteine protease
VITKPKIKPKRLAETKKTKKEARVEQSLGIRIVALTMNLLLIIASASYVPTLPIATFMFAAIAILGSYLAYAFRNSRPAWVGTIPTVATILLFTNFFFELFTGYTNGMHTAVGAFIHMLTGLLALHCFDLRSRTDFSISALIGLGLLTCLAGMAKDVIYGFYIFTYTILAGLLLFYDSSSRSHEIGPSRAVPSANAAAAARATQKDAQAATQVKPPEMVIKRLRIASLSPFIPVFILPFLSYLAFSGMPRIDSVIDIFRDNFVRAQLPISAALSDQLGKGGRSQSIRGGAPDTKAQGGASYTVTKSNQSGTASGSSPDKGDSGSGSGSGSGNGNTGNNSNGQKNSGKGGKPGTGGLPSPEALKALATEKALNEAYQKEVVELRGAANQLEEIVLKVSSPQPSYIRRYSLNNFDGVQWTRSVPVATTTIRPTPNSRIGLDLTASDAVYVPPRLPTLEVKQDFRIEQDNVFGHILPASWIPQLVKQKGKEDAEIRVDGDGTIKLISTLQRGSAYSVVSQLPVYDFDQMRHLPLETIEQVTDDRDNEIKLARSCQTPYTAGGDEIEKLANDVAGKEGNWFYRSDKICQYLRKNYKYEPGSFYTEDTPAPATASAFSPAPAAETKQVQKIKETKESFVEDFLFVKKRGNCRHFATAFVLLCRAQGIPARIVTGFLPGQLNKTTGYWEVRGKHAHVWAEIYLPYWNWVPFDATPSGQLPTHEEGGNALTRFVKSGLANPFGQNYSPSRKPRHQKERTQREGDLSGDKGNDTKNNKFGLFDFGANKGKSQKIQLPLIGNVDQGLMQQFFKYSIVFFALLALAAILFVYLKQREETERREYLQTHKPSTLIFLEVLSDLKRYELLKGPTETADELSLRLGDRISELAKGGRYIPDELPEMVSNFMEIYSEDRFGGADKLDELTIISGKIKSLVQSKARK